MDWKALGQKVAQAAPLLGGALGGPGGAALGGLIASTFGGDPDNPEDLASRILGDPESRVKLQEIQTRHKERLEELALERFQAELEAQTAQHAETQATHRTEAEHGTDYVKNTRPHIARMSFYAGMAYALVSTAAALIMQAWGGDAAGMLPDPGLLAALFGPAAIYMGMRSFDGSRWGRGKT